jgi:CRP-like cAMP-binding protein
MTVEVGIIGREGMTGLAVLNGSDRSPYSTFMQVGGAGHRMSAHTLRRLLEHTGLRSAFSRWAQAFMIQATQTTVANARATIEERLARWLLMSHDRVDGDELALTHEFLSLMMGAGRPGVTEAVHALSRKGLIRGGRGMIVILDRDGLLERAGSFYGTPESEYERLLGGQLDSATDRSRVVNLR